jgi:hypothetical protein
LAEAPSILDELEKELRQYGVVGSTDYFKVLLLAIITRTSDSPVSVMLKGSATVGKSYTLETVLKYVPADAYVMWSGMSEKALIYSEEPFVHRMLCIGEHAGLQSDKGNPWLRQLLTEGRLIYSVTEEGPDGKRVAREVRKDGPTGVITTTTSLRIHPEDETRLISLYLDDDPEQTKAVLMAQARKAQGLVANRANAEPWRALMAWVAEGPRQAVIPFADQIAAAMDPKQGRQRRDFPKVLALVGAHALLHQSRRKRDGEGRVLAEVADYEAVHRLLDGPLSRARAEELTEPVREVVAAVSVLSSWPENARDGVTQKAIAQYLAESGDGCARDPSVISRQVNAALEAGFLINAPNRAGKAHQLRVGEAKRRSRSALPPPTGLKPEGHD